jgi:hypothetical protein
MVSRFLPLSQISGRMYNTVVVVVVVVRCKKRVAARHYADIEIQLLFANNRNRVPGAVLGLSQDGACTDLFENLSATSLKGELSNDTKFNPPPLNSTPDLLISHNLERNGLAKIALQGAVKANLANQTQYLSHLTSRRPIG